MTAEQVALLHTGFKTIYIIQDKQAKALKTIGNFLTPQEKPAELTAEFVKFICGTGTTCQQIICE